MNVGVRKGDKKQKIKIKENVDQGFSLSKEILSMTIFLPILGKKGSSSVSLTASHMKYHL